MKLHLWLLFAVTASLLAQEPAPTSKLDQPAANFSVVEEDVRVGLQLLARTYGLTIVADPDVSGTVTFDLKRGVVRDILAALCRSNGFTYEEVDGTVHVRKYITRYYTVEYPQIQRSSSDTSSVSLSGGQGGQTSYGGGGGYGGQGSYGNNGQGVGVGGGGGGGSGGQSSSMQDQTTFQVTTKNDTDLWGSLGGDLKMILAADESFFINKFSGIVGVRALGVRHDLIAEYFTKLNAIINTEVFIETRIIEVVLKDERKEGIDWNQAISDAGSGVLLGATSDTNITSLASNPLSANTFNGTIKIGKLAGVINALDKQGTVYRVTNPILRTMNNQTAFQIVGSERSFFSVDTTFTPIFGNGTATNGVGGTGVFETEIERRYTFGVILKVTPFVRSNGTITLDVHPAFTRFDGVDESQSKKRTSPIMDTKRTATMVNLREGEAAIVGGMIVNSSEAGKNGVPYLANIPALGRLFKTVAKSKGSSELFVIVSATTKTAAVDSHINELRQKSQPPSPDLEVQPKKAAASKSSPSRK